jgi:phage terminase large subunit
LDGRINKKSNKKPNIVAASVLAGKNLNYQIPKIKVSLESYKAYKDGFRIIANQGGTRSGKTYTITQLLIALALKEKVHISICSVAFPHLRRGVMRDWMTIMDNTNMYDPNEHTRTEQLYHYPTGSIIEFFSVDNNLKVRGPGRDILFVNECNLIDKDTFRQLLLRTRKTVFIDYNPADEFHWIYDEVLTRPDCYFIKSTYLDNPYLPLEQIKEIERLKDIDENAWRIYGEGERGHSEGIIYTNWNIYSGAINGQSVYGLDFGFNNPTALVKITENDRNLYAEEVIYQSGITNQELISLLKAKVKPHEPIFADAAEPQRIEEIRRAGFNIRAANKAVKDGIDFIKSHKLYINRESFNMQKEIRSYKYQVSKANKNTSEEPIKLNDHAMDAMRYAAMGLKKQSGGVNVTFHR